DYALHQPEFAVVVNADSLEPSAFERWREPISSGEQPLAHRLSPAARALPTAHLDALQEELLLLTDRIAPLAWNDALPGGQDVAAVQRYDLLFRWLVPSGLVPYYQRLDGRFLGWLATALAAVGQLPLDTPTPDPSIRVPPRLIPDPWDHV